MAPWIPVLGASGIEDLIPNSSGSVKKLPAMALSSGYSTEVPDDFLRKPLWYAGQMQSPLLLAIKAKYKQWLPVGLVEVLVELLKHRAYGWANEKLDKESGPMIYLLARCSGWAIQHPIETFLIFVAVYCLGVVVHSQLAVEHQKRQRLLAPLDTDENLPALAPAPATDLEVSIDDAIFQPKLNATEVQDGENWLGEIHAASIFLRCKIVNHAAMPLRIHNAKLAVSVKGTQYSGGELLSIPQSYVFYRNSVTQEAFKVKTTQVWDSAKNLRPEEIARPHDSGSYWLWFVAPSVSAQEVRDSAILTLDIIYANERTARCVRDGGTQPWKDGGFIADTSTAGGDFIVSRLGGQQPPD